MKKLLRKLFVWAGCGAGAQGPPGPPGPPGLAGSPGRDLSGDFDRLESQVNGLRFQVKILTEQLGKAGLL